MPSHNSETSKELEFPIYIQPDPPPTLDAILENFKHDQAGKKDGKELLERIQKSEQNFKDGAPADDVSIHAKVGMDISLHKDEHHVAFIEYMGLTFYWQSKQKSDFAWHYYSKAQYYLGIYNSWDHVIRHLIDEDLKRQDRAKGGKSRSSPTAEPVMNLFLRFIVENKPDGGWKSKGALVKEASISIGEAIEHWGKDSIPFFDSLPRTLRAWLDGFNDASLLYERNRARDTHDTYPY